MAEGGGGTSRTPYECVCGFTAGTSFVWEKHLALRNTPYSSVRHSRVIRAGGDQSPHHKSSYESETPLGLSRLNNERDDAENMGPTATYPTPKALFRERPATAGYSTSDSLSKASPFGRSPSPTSRNALNGIRLQDAASRGDMERVARLAVEILRLAQQGDSEGVLDVISDRSLSKSPVPELPIARKTMAPDFKFAANITAVHQSPAGFSIEQVRLFVLLCSSSHVCANLAGFARACVVGVVK